MPWVAPLSPVPRWPAGPPASQPARQPARPPVRQPGRRPAPANSKSPSVAGKAGPAGGLGARETTVNVTFLEVEWLRNHNRRNGFVALCSRNISKRNVCTAPRGATMSQLVARNLDRLARLAKYL